MSTGWDWKALAEAVITSRQALGLTQAALADRSATSTRAVVLLESGKPRMRLPLTLGRIESALGWAPGDALRVLKDVSALPQRSLVVVEPTVPEPVKSNLGYGTLQHLQGDLDAAVVEVNASMLRAVIAEVGLLRSRLLKYEPLPEPVDCGDLPF